MKRFADSIARQKGIKPPAGYTKSGSVCRAFLEQHAPKKTKDIGGKAVGGPEARPPSLAQLSFAERVTREKCVAISGETKANAAAMSVWIDTNQGGKLGKGCRKTVNKSSSLKATKSTTPTRRAQKPKATSASANVTPLLASEQQNSTAITPLQIPYGNKEVAQKLGARYAAGGWYAPPGVDLTEFKSKGWL